MDDVRLILDALTVDDEMEEVLDDLLLETLDDDNAAIVAALEEEGLLQEHKPDWHNAEDKVRNFDEACARLGDSHIEHFTRFTKDEIKTLATEMRIPSGSRAGGIPGDMALVFLLCRLAHPFRLKTLKYIFGWYKNRIGRWTNWLIQWMFDEWGHLLELNVERFRREAPRYAAAFGKRLGYEEVDRCRNILQVHCCFMEICHPKYVQELYYNGHYKGHGLKFQVCTGANGLLESVFGPVVGRTHDITMWRTSRVARDIDRLRAMNIFPDDDGGGADAEPADKRWFAVGDSAYIGAPEHVLIPHDRSLPLTREQRRFNRLLSRTRVTSEWGIGHVYTLWSSLRCPLANRIHVNPIGKHFVAACILTNCRTCIRGENQISKYFDDCAPPSLAEYLDYPKPPENRLRRFMNASVRMLERYGVRAN